ncbi:SDR family oxidoreductase [Sinorhizobium meliloti]|uniref:SDR family oxidoreductase n=1 Tax=Rhizobium meliloti TaxID=382 RepID=UPI000FDAD793|nr:SDR family oxidoreductase [Sinorhizobium meliloti]RVL75883.1 SDR family oxidoreductase [Sinorhizobium meliloti]
MAQGKGSGEGRIALVTGGGTGVGRGIAQALSAEGYSVVITGRRPDVLDAAAGEIGGRTGNIVRAVVCDVGDPDQVAALFAAVRAEFARLDLLVNNAGSNVPPVPLEEVTFEQWNGIVAANLTGAFLCTQHAFRMMKAQTPRGGRIINNGSISAQTPRPNSAPYTATKHAITGEVAAEPTISIEHIAEAVVYMASLPLSANVLTMTVMATRMPLVGRG